MGIELGSGEESLAHRAFLGVLADAAADVRVEDGRTNHLLAHAAHRVGARARAPVRRQLRGDEAVLALVALFVGALAHVGMVRQVALREQLVAQRARGFGLGSLFGGGSGRRRSCSSSSGTKSTKSAEAAAEAASRRPRGFESPKSRRGGSPHFRLVVLFVRPLVFLRLVAPGAAITVTVVFASVRAVLGLLSVHEAVAGAGADLPSQTLLGPAAISGSGGSGGSDSSLFLRGELAREGRVAVGVLLGTLPQMALQL
jgi:hypothetical protein